MVKPVRLIYVNDKAKRRFTETSSQKGEAPYGLFHATVYMITTHLAPNTLVSFMLVCVDNGYDIP